MSPTITVAIPLHRSGPWVDNVVDNVRALPAEVTEILVSDKTGLDGAAEELRARLADDPRVTVQCDPSGLSWEEHFQWLLEQGTGDQFMWMPHDDRFDPTWIPILADDLAANPEAWLAFGRLERVAADGVTAIGSSWPRQRPPGLIHGWKGLRMMLDGEMGVPFRGLFRRQEVVDAGLRLRPATRFAAVDMLWVFAVALRSGLVYNDTTTTWKRYHPANTHGTWPRRRPGDLERETLTLLRLHGPGGVQGVTMRSFTRWIGAKRRLRSAVGRALRFRRVGPREPTSRSRPSMEGPP